MLRTPRDPGLRRKLDAIARRYEREGYRVTRPEEGAPLPPFLEGCAPDLIAESEQDRVVVEVKRTDALRGSNDLRAIAERVADQPGWRFELVTLAARLASPPSAEGFAAAERRVRQAVDVGLIEMAHRYVLAMIEELLVDLAERNRLKVGNAPFGRILRDLAIRGLLSREDFETVLSARGVQRWSSGHAAQVDPADIEVLLALGRRLREEAAANGDALGVS